MTKYQGWANYETWNVALWLSNDYGLYKACQAFAREHGCKVTAEQAEAFVREELPEGTLDFEDMGGAKAYDVVNWQEIADDINDMGQP